MAQAQHEINNMSELLTVEISGQIFGIPVLQIEDVLAPHKITKIPLAPKEVAGALNLRGRIVTAINVRERLGLEPYAEGKPQMSVVIEHDSELYSLIIDKVGDVLTLKDEDFESNPATMEKLWRDVSQGIYRLDGQLLIVLDVSRLLEGVSGQLS